jgi:hypothetical protein
VVFRFALYVGFSVLLAWQTISVTYSGGIKGVTQGGSESPQERYNWATQWSLPPAELWNAVSGSYFGTSMNSPTKPYWGRNGRTPGWETTRQGMRNFVLTGWHIGVIPCTLLLALLALALRSLRSRPSSITGGRRSPPAERKRKGPGVGTSAPLLGGAGGGSEFAQRQLQPTPNPSQGGERLPTVHRPLPTAHCSPPSALGPLPSLPWLILTGAAVTMMLMWGRHFFLYKLFWSLPYMSTFRCADKWIGPLLLFTGLGSAVVLDAIWKSLSGKDARSSAEGADQTPSRTSVQIPHDNGLWRILAYAFGGMALLALLIAIGTAGQHNAFIAARTAEGYQELAELMWSNAINASFKVFLIAGLCAAGAWWVGRRQAKGLQTSPVIVLATIGIIAAADLWIANRPYVNGHKYKHFLQPNPLTDYLDAHRNEGRIKLMPPNHPLLNNIRMTLLQVKGYDLFDPVSVSRMPTDYAALFKALDANPARLWELGSLRYFLTLPGAAEQLNRMDGNRGRFVERLALGIGVVDGSYLPVATGDPKQQYLRLVEFTGALPLFRLATKVITVAPTPEGDEQALRMLSAPGFDPSIAIWHAATNWPKEFPFAEGTGTVSVKSQSPSHIAITVYAATRCMLVRTCKFDDQWHAAIDGVRTNIERVDALFQGLIVPQGQHEIVLNYKPPAHMLATALAMRATLFLLCMFHLRHKSPRILQET